MSSGDLINWMLVFVRISALLAIFPLFSSQNFPVQVRLALGALVAMLVAPGLPVPPLNGLSVWSLVGLLIGEVGVGLVLGFVSRMVFYAIDFAGGIIGTEIGLTFSPNLNPLNNSQVDSPGLILYFLAAMLLLSLDMHHWLLMAFQRSYLYLPVGRAHLSEALLGDVLARTSQIFAVAVQLSAPVIGVSFIISLVFSVLGRAVPQMNVFSESFSFRILVGLAVFGLSLNLMAQHLLNYLRRLPDDVLRIAQLFALR
jgi:flagellar biosynthesis protein FliR